LILIASVLLLNAAPKGAAQEQGPRLTIHRKVRLAQKGTEGRTPTQTDTIGPSPTAVTETAEPPAIQTPVAHESSARIQQHGWSGVRTALQILFTLVTAVATVCLAKFTYQLVTVTADLHEATQGWN
jgi:hypothetical protein